MFGNTIGPAEIGIVLAIALLIFGPKKLPELGKGLGRGMRDFKRAVTGDDAVDRKIEEDGINFVPAPERIATVVQVVEPTVVEVEPTVVGVKVTAAADEGR